LIHVVQLAVQLRYSSPAMVRSTRKTKRKPAAPPEGPRIGLALGSGSARGLAHIGVIEALTAHGIEPDVVCGSSIGALVGAAYVTGKIEALETWARGITWREMARLLDLKIANGGLIEGRRLVRFLRKLQDDAPIEDLDKAFAAVATDLMTGHEIWLRDGSLIDAIRASMALPGILSPVLRDGHRLVDGGLVNPVPIAPCRALGAEVIIAVNLNGEIVGRRGERRARVRRPRALRAEALERITKEFPESLRGLGWIAPKLLGAGVDKPGYFDVIFGSLNIMQDRITRSRMAGDPPDVVITPRLQQIGLLEFNRAGEAIEAGRAAVEQALPAVHEALAAAAAEHQR
jgi:NTE family protein